MSAIIEASLPPQLPLRKNTYLRVLIRVSLLILALGFAVLLVYVGMTMGALERE
jgi:hypothetical protein